MSQFGRMLFLKDATSTVLRLKGKEVAALQNLYVKLLYLQQLLSDPFPVLRFDLGDMDLFGRRRHLLQFFLQQRWRQMRGSKGQVNHLVGEGNIDNDAFDQPSAHAHPNSFRRSCIAAVGQDFKRWVLDYVAICRSSVIHSTGENPIAFQF